MNRSELIIALNAEGSYDSPVQILTEDGYVYDPVTVELDTENGHLYLKVVETEEQE